MLNLLIKWLLPGSNLAFHKEVEHDRPVEHYVLMQKLDCIEIYYIFFQLNFRLKLKSIIQKLSEHCDIKNPQDLETEIVSKY